ncbi:cytoplasmic polyadenylation element-binding protein 4-like isoform X2 [Oncorhynchus kisutch]|uniref:cytoplasmic polyadenylation element-binding protein 4-like isoform X2 n=1 Tax=Oncorhynchus kisutch TaxID=8019 RepID=UPI0012DDF544|nr:cytoplasmic polyadenylation element-binding protein 4-like isoform X2 [Oncorhynchus kisutch]
MDDYGFGVLVKNNCSGNKSAFPVRIPHLQPQPSHLNHSANPPSPPSFINSTSATNGGGSAWLFPSVTPHSNMQDEILDSDKAKALDLQEKAQPQALSPGQQEARGGLGELDGSLPEDCSLEKGSLESSGGKEKLRGGMDSPPVLGGFDYQDSLGMATSGAQSTTTTSSLTSFNNWSPAVPSNPSPVVSEDVGSGFFGPAGSNANGPPMLFQNFSHHAGPGFGGVGGSFSPQIGPVSQHHPSPHPHHYHPHNQGVPPHPRRSPASPHPPQPSFPPHPHRSGAFTQLPHLAPAQSKPPSPWGSYQSPAPSTPTSTSWSPGVGYGGWGGSQGVREYRRGLNGGVTALNSISPLKKSFPNNQVPSQKYLRNNSGFNHKPWMEDSMSRTDNFPFQERTRSFDGFSMHSLENSLIDIMRAEQDSLKGRYGFSHQGGDMSLPMNARSYGRRRGHSNLFPMGDEHSFGEDESGDQGLPGLGSAHCFPQLNGERVERYSRKVFVGGLPPDIDEDEITASFRRFGHLFVDWPHKAESKSYFPPKGYAFLLFQDESSVQDLIDACIEEDGKLYLCVSSPTIKDKPVQIRPWNLNDSDFVMDGSQPLDPRKTIFVGGVPRPLRAVELAMIMDRLYGGVCYAGIDTDPELKYPKGAGRVAFSNQQSYIAAISARFVQLQHGEIDKRVEVKPYVLDDQLCDECQGTRCGGKFAPFFCANVTCLQYYCEYCWAAIHSRAGREFHKPLVKEGGDRPRHISFRWN